MATLNQSLNGAQNVLLSIPAPGAGRRIIIRSAGASVANASLASVTLFQIVGDALGELMRSALADGVVNIDGYFVFDDNEAVDLELTTDAVGVDARVWAAGLII